MLRMRNSPVDRELLLGGVAIFACAKWLYVRTYVYTHVQDLPLISGCGLVN